MIYDVVVVGGGPAGMQAAIAAQTEGFATVVVEADRIGGQIKDTPILENLAGYAFGVSGPVLAHNMAQQATRLGVHVRKGKAVGLIPDGHNGLLVLLDYGGVVGDHITGRSVVLAMGAQYVELDIPGLQECRDHVVFYSPERACLTAAHGQEVVVVGGGNSAGQAVITLAQTAKVVHMLVRDKLAVSHYLRERINGLMNVVVHEQAQVWRMTRMSNAASGCLLDVHYSDDSHNALFANMVLLCTATEPQTDWLPDAIHRNGGFIAGDYGSADASGFGGWPAGYSRSPYTTSMPGVFVIGDVRAGGIRRVPAAFGDAAAVQRPLR
jgi:thioredoxin reductase (NADPH)